MAFKGFSELSKKVLQIEDEVISYRRCFHQIPELGFEEYETTEKIITLLDGMKIRPDRLTPTGVTAYIGSSKGKTIALRADIDGLMVQEQTDLPFASVYCERMHACGHDGHIAALLGAAKILKEYEEELPVRVKLIFQPSEENTQGAKKLIEQGILSDVDVIFGLHLFSDLPCGKVNIVGGPRMAQTDRFRFIFSGKGGHAGKPHQCIDATVMAADFVMSVQSIVSRMINPVHPAVLTIGSFHSGTQYNIISGEAVVEGTCRSFEEEDAMLLRDECCRRAKAIAEYFGGCVESFYEYGSHPPVMNDTLYSKKIKECADKMIGENCFIEVPPLMLGDDFSWYQKNVPGVYAFAGCRRKDQKECYPNHHPRFDIDEDALTTAVALYLSAIFCHSEENG